MEPIDWLWNGWLAKGKFHIIAGAKGDGKSTLAFKKAATISSGGKWPDGTRAAIGTIVIWSGEDSASDTIVPRLKQMGADLRKIKIIQGVIEGGKKIAFDPAIHMPQVEAALATCPML